MPTQAFLQELLDSAYYVHNRVGAISEQHLDPLLVVYENSHRANLSAIALVCALFAYGNVGAIVKFLRKLDFSLLGEDWALRDKSAILRGGLAHYRAGIYLGDNEQAPSAESRKSAQKPTPKPQNKQSPASLENEDSRENAPILHTQQAAGFCDDFVGCQAGGAGIYLGDNEQAPSAESRKSAQKPTPKLSKTKSPRLEHILHTTFPYYRFQTSDDVKLLFASLACIIAQGGLESTFPHRSSPLTVISALSQAIYTHASRILASSLYAAFFSHDYRARFLASKQFSQGFRFLVGVSPSSPLKRWNMFLRWLVRKDHIDVGLWQGILSPSDLLLPLDTHTLYISRQLSLLQRKSYDRKAVLEVSAALRQFCAYDPIRYDFALYRLGQSGVLATAEPDWQILLRTHINIV